MVMSESSAQWITLLVALMNFCTQCLVFVQILLFMWMHYQHNQSAVGTNHRVKWLQTAMEKEISDKNIDADF